MLADARIVAMKDLRIELRSRVGINQILPVALLILLLFGFALDPDSAVLARATPGLFWVAVLVVAVLAVERSVAVEAGDGVVILYGRDLAGHVLLLATVMAATAGIAAAGTLYGVLASGLRVRETLLPLLLLPVLAPVLIAATRAFETALDGLPSQGWPWFNLLAVFALTYTGFGILAFGSLLEDS